MCKTGVLCILDVLFIVFIAFISTHTFVVRLPDLLVGAPFFFTREEGGAVYIYMNKDHCLNCIPPIKLTGKPESRYNNLLLFYIFIDILHLYQIELLVVEK